MDYRKIVRRISAGLVFKLDKFSGPTRRGESFREREPQWTGFVRAFTFGGILLSQKLWHQTASCDAATDALNSAK